MVVTYRDDINFNSLHKEGGLSINGKEKADSSEDFTLKVTYCFGIDYFV